MTTPWYDTKEGIQEAIDKGIAGLNELAKARSDAGYKRDERMSEWCILRAFTLSCNGNFSIIIEGAPADHQQGYKLDNVATIEEARETCGGRWASTIARLPPVVEKCHRCLRGWDLRNIRDYHQRHRQDSPHIHETCYKLKAIDDEIEFFQDVLEGAGMIDCPLRIIPNEYHSGLYANPWFIIESKWGPIRIGWRKRVINIDWSQSKMKHDGTVLFKEIHDKGITCWETGIHAYGKDAAIEHLSRLARASQDSP